jgi:two-component system response regulator YesN
LETVRIEAASELLISTDMNIKETAEQIGYSSAHVFRRAFKRVTGVLPLEYRQSQHYDK